MTLSESLTKHILIKSNSIRRLRNIVLIDFEVTAGASCTGIKGYNRWRDRIRINLHTLARKNQANIELIKLLSNILMIDQKQVNIIKGEHSDLKTVEIDGLEYNDIIDRIFEVLNEKHKIK